MVVRRSFVVLTLFLLVGCGGPSEAALQSTAQAIAQANPVVVTQVVQQTVIVTATPLPATPTPVATATPVATPTPEQTRATAKQATAIQALPGSGHTSRADVSEGQSVIVNFRTDGWYAVELNDVVGWVPADTLTIDDATAQQVPPFPGPFPVVVGDIVQEELAGSIVFKGTVQNFGSETASGVIVQIETHDAKDQRVDLVDAPVMTLNVAPGATERFQGITQYDYATYGVSVRCNNCD